MSEATILGTPIKIGTRTAKNRIGLSPMCVNLGDSLGHVTQRTIDYYEARARGGAGVVIVENAHVDGKASRGMSAMLAAHSDGMLPGLNGLAEAITRHGALAILQINHMGRQGDPSLIDGPLVAPSAEADPVVGSVPRALETDDLESIKKAFCDTAARAMAAGFDGVEVHMAHGYLLNQFLSPLFNRRTDAYGGDLAGRARLPLEVLHRVRETTGDRLPILCRLSADDGVPASLGLAEACTIAMMLEQAGAAVIDVTAGIGESFAVSAPPMFYPPGTLVPYAAAIKAVVKVPVIAVGKLHDPLLAEQVLATGKADLIAIGRGLIADPDWAQKTAEGRLDDIRPCLTCNRPECHGRILRQLDMGCVVNAVVGREALFRLSPAPNPRRLLVAGGGPAALEVARVAALRGHQVILCEQDQSLGGQLSLAAAPPYKTDIHKLSRYLTGQLARLGVEVRLNCPVTPELVAKVAPEAVVVATGARPLVPNIPGAAEHAVTAWDVLAARVPVGERVVVVGGGDVGCETAEYLAAQGRRVTIVEMLPDVAGELAAWTRRLLVDRLVVADVEILTQTRVVTIGAGRVTYERGGVNGEITPVDSVVLACGVLPRRELADSLRETGVPIYVIGDALKPRNLADAIREGFELGFSL